MIDSFQIDHPGCTEIEKDLIISGNDIDNLDGLSVLTSILGDLYIGYWSGGVLANPPGGTGESDFYRR